MTSTPHDALYKAIFQVAEHAAAELQHVLPPAVVGTIDWSTLSLRSGSYVDEELAARHSDLLFAAATVLGSPVLVYLLFEHQSSDDGMMAFRLLEAMVRIWDRERTEAPGQPLPVIIPAVLSHASDGWKASTRFSGLFAPELGALEAYVPDFSYAVDDLEAVSDDALRDRAMAAIPKVALWMLRDARNPERFLRSLGDWAPLMETIAAAPNGREALLVLLRYIALVSDEMHLEKIRVTLEGRAPAAERLTMTTIAEHWRAEGKAEGRLEGKLEGKLESKVESVLLLLDGRRIPVDEAQRSRIAACTDAETLDQWLLRAATAATADALFED